MAKSALRGVGKAGFVREHGLYTDSFSQAAEKSREVVEKNNLRTVRMIWVDQHGVPRVKFMSSEDYLASLESGIDFSGALFSLDSGNFVFTQAFAEGGGFDIPELSGFPDLVLVPDPATLRVLPFADRTGWVLTDAYFANGKPVSIDCRRLLRDQVSAAADMGFDYIAGLEVEFYVVRLETGGRIDFADTGWPPPPPKVSAIEQGYQYLSEVRLAGLNSLLETLRDAYLAVGLPLRSMEDEWGPGQLEITMDIMEGLDPADAMVLFRSITKQICQDQGLLASFMCRPNLPNAFSSGWHLHESLRDRKTGENAFTSDDNNSLSVVGRQFVAGILDHALPMTVFSNPTINGYKRFRPYSFAPDRVGWCEENRGALIRVQAQPGEKGAHIENRMGEPAANPYLYLASNLAAGLDGIRRQLTPPPLGGSDPYADENATKLPNSLWAATDALDGDAFFREQFGPDFIKFLIMMKRNEVSRFLSEVTDWEMREYFEFY
jgi:glutamine synthetase